MGGDVLLNLEKQLSRLENRFAAKNDIPSATNLALRYWQASQFSQSETDARTLMQRANHTTLTTHRRNPSHVDMYTLAIFIAIEAGHYDSAYEMLEKAMGHKSYLRSNARYRYAIMCFLYTYLGINQGQTRIVKKYWRALTKHIKTAAPSADYTIMQGLLHLAVGEFERAFDYLREAFRNGSSSIFLYEGLYRYYRTTPNTPESGIILAVLIYVANRRVDISDIALYHQNALFTAISANPEAGEHLYNITGHSPLLHKICAHRISNGDLSPQAYSYYKMAEYKQISVDGLAEFIVHGAFVNKASDVSHYTMARFLETADMEPNIAVYVYHLLITTPNMKDLLQSHHSNIMQLAINCMEADLPGKEANSLYHYFWQKSKASGITDEHTSKSEEILSPNLTMFEITVDNNSSLRHIYITEPESRGMALYNLQEHDTSLLVEANSHNLSYSCMGAGQRAITEEKLVVSRMIPGVGAELYQHFFDKGDRRFHLLIYLANHYLKQDDPPQQATAVFEAALAEKAITKPYRMRILAALGRLYYKASNFTRVLECYDEIDEDALDKDFTKQILSIYMQTNETERAIQLLIKKHSHIPGEILLDAVCTLLGKPVDTSYLAEAAYQLLIGGFYTNQLLDLVLAHYKASYSEWVALAQNLDNISCPPLDIRILETALWMAQWDVDGQKAFVRVYNLEDECELLPQFVEFATYELLANSARPEYDTLDILEHWCLDDTTNHLLIWGLANCYLQHNIATYNSDKILALAVDALEKEGVILPVFKESRFIRAPFIEKHQPFLYRGLPGKNYQLHYRIGDAEDFAAVPMQHIKYGLHTAHLPLFYNEEITYYFSEVLATGSIATKAKKIKNTNPFLHDNHTDQFFAINNAIIYEQMFKHEQVESIIDGLVKDAQEVKSKLL